MSERRSALIVDGEAGGPWHRWPETTPVLVKLLAETGLFRTEVVTLRDSGMLGPEDTPDFNAFDVVIMNYEAPDERWSPQLKTRFENYVAGGGGLVVYHGASSGFAGWREYNEMTGLGGWGGRNSSAGHYCYVRDGIVVHDHSDGPTGSHGVRLPFQVVTREPEHPITRGLPDTWMHFADELYDRLRGPGSDVVILATAFSSPANSGSGRHEPVLLAVTWHGGRVFHTTLGHDVMSMSCPGFIATFQRGCEWAATGGVSQALPAGFPTSYVTSRVDVLELDPAYRHGLNPIDGVR